MPARPALSVLTSGHDVADARLHRVVRAARAHGLTVEVLGLGDAAGGPRDADLVTRPRPASVLRRLGLALTLPWRARGRVLMVLDPDLVVPALVRCRLGGRRLVVDVHEDYAALVRDRAWADGPVGRVVRALVGAVTWVCTRADLVVVADEHVPPLSAGSGPDGGRRLVLRNLPTPDYLPAPAPPGPQPRLVYIGDVRASRGLFAMLGAVEAAPGWELDVVGPVAPADAEAVERWCATSPAADRVRWHGRQPPEQAWATARGAWAGLCLLDDTPAFRDAVPTKLYEYLGAGLPVLVTPRPRMVELVEGTGAGEIVTDAADAARTLRGWSAEPERLAALRASALAAASRFADGTSAYEGFARRVAALVR